MSHHPRLRAWRRVGAGAARCAVLCLAGALALALAPQPLLAGELPTVELDMRNGVLTPDRLEVPAGTRFKIIVRNSGTTPAEFESLRLRKEKVLSPGAESFVVINRLSPGEYPFFDEFHPDTGQGVIVAK